MKWLGKAIGGALGLLIGGPLGAIIGTAIGHQYDRKEETQTQKRHRPDPELQELFFEALFAAMGRVAKSDGRVREEEIVFAEDFMRRMGFNATQRRQAIEAFRRGKSPDFDLDRLLSAFHRRAASHPEFFTLFLETLLRLARCDGAINLEEEQQLLLLCRKLGISSFQYLTLKVAVEGQFRFQEQRQQQWRRHTSARQTSLSRLEACRILGVSPTASRDEIKRAYRRLMSRYHPDKLAATGASETRVRAATEKVQQIRRAYEVLMQ